MTEALLRECFELVAGALRWRTRPQSHFATEKESRRWNTRYAGTCVSAQLVKGYRRVRFSSGGRRIKVAEHRLVFFLTNGHLPVEVDHKDLDRSNNSPDNLRAADSTLNKGNTRARGACGFKGVTFDSERGKWKANIRVGARRREFLGRFDRPEDAAQAYAQAAVRVFGEFARV